MASARPVSGILLAAVAPYRPRDDELAKAGSTRSTWAFTVHSTSGTSCHSSISSGARWPRSSTRGSSRTAAATSGSCIASTDPACCSAVVVFAHPARAAQLHSRRARQRPLQHPVGQPRNVRLAAPRRRRRQHRQRISKPASPTNRPSNQPSKPSPHSKHDSPRRTGALSDYTLQPARSEGNNLIILNPPNLSDLPARDTPARPRTPRTSRTP